jgi:radical SAM superfamily enzyme YgiQ (UPF0313 family)
VRVVLFNPAPRSGWQVQRRIELPLGLLCVATPLDSAGWDVRIVEEYGNRRWRTELVEALREECVCFGVTSMTGPQLLHAVRACEIVRQQRPGLPIVWGGIHASLLPEQTLRSGWTDVVVVGEGEETLQRLVEAIAARRPLAEVDGIAYLEEGRFRATAPRPFIDLGTQPPQRLEDWAAFNFRKVRDDAAWVHPRTRRLVDALDFPLMFLGKGHFVTPYKRTNPLAVLLARMYYPLARHRVTTLDVRFPIETRLARSLGVFGRQD